MVGLHSGLGGGHSCILATIVFKPLSALVFGEPGNSQHTCVSYFFEEVTKKQEKGQKMAIFPRIRQVFLSEHECHKLSFSNSTLNS